MNIQIKTVNYELTTDEAALFENKFSALSKYGGKEETEFYLYVTLGKETEHHQSGDDLWLAEGKAEINGKSYFAKATKDTLANAVDSVVSELSREMRKEKTKRSALLKKGGARLKDWLRFGR